MLKPFPIFYLVIILFITSCSSIKIKDIEVGEGWANNSVNTTIFRKNAVASAGDYQFLGYYDNSGKMIIAKRELGLSNFDLNASNFKGNAKDAHNSISLAVDGDQKLHISWDHHDNPLNYAVGSSLKHGVGNMPNNTEVDVPLTYGDYYFVEALKRYQGI